MIAHYTHMSEHSKIKLRRTLPSHHNECRWKPLGFWYAIGTSWWEWCSSEMEDWVAPYIYTFDFLVDNNMLLLNTPEAVVLFNTMYGINPLEHIDKRYFNIDWAQVNRDYDGVEFNPYFWQLRHDDFKLWYSGIDVPSGVVFNTNIIQNLLRHDTKTYLKCNHTS